MRRMFSVMLCRAGRGAKSPATIVERTLEGAQRVVSGIAANRSSIDQLKKS